MKADQLLVEEVKRGNKASFSELVHRHQMQVLRLATRITRDLEMAEDVAQDSFIKAFQKIELFEGRASFRSWLLQITANTAKNKLRSLRREEISVEDIEVSVDDTTEARLATRDANSIIRVEIEKLPSKQKMALTLRIFDDLSFKEIATIMSCPYDTAKANYRHALLKLRHRLGNLPSLRDFTNNFEQDDYMTEEEHGTNRASEI